MLWESIYNFVRQKGVRTKVWPRSATGKFDWEDNAKINGSVALKIPALLRRGRTYPYLLGNYLLGNT